MRVQICLVMALPPEQAKAELLIKLSFICVFSCASMEQLHRDRDAAFAVNALPRAFVAPWLSLFFYLIYLQLDDAPEVSVSTALIFFPGWVGAAAMSASLLSIFAPELFVDGKLSAGSSKRNLAFCAAPLLFMLFGHLAFLSIAPVWLLLLFLFLVLLPERSPSETDHRAVMLLLAVVLILPPLLMRLVRDDEGTGFVIGLYACIAAMFLLAVGAASVHFRQPDEPRRPALVRCLFSWSLAAVLVSSLTSFIRPLRSAPLLVKVVPAAVLAMITGAALLAEIAAHQLQLHLSQRSPVVIDAPSALHNVRALIDAECARAHLRALDDA